MASTGTLSERVRVAVVDDDPGVRLFLKAALQSSDGFEFARGFSTAGEAITDIPVLLPDVTLVDVGLPDLNGVECTKRLMQVLPGLKILILSGTDDGSWIDASLRAGALAFLVKPFNMSQFVTTLRFVTLRSAAERNKREHDARATSNAALTLGSLRLSEREHQVLSGLADGLLYKEISDSLGISYAAVHKCQHKIFEKLHASNRSEAIRIWLQYKNDSLS